MWTCNYCKQSRPGSETTCSGCGAGMPPSPKIKTARSNFSVFDQRGQTVGSQINIGSTRLFRRTKK